MKSPDYSSENLKFSTQGFNIVKLYTLIKDSNPQIETIKDESMVLVIGNTGAGKSTTINYLRDIVLEEKKFDGAKCIDIKDPASEKDAAKIGHEVKSETFYPALYKHKDFNYLDTPGFAENRSKEESVCAIFNTRTVIKLAKEIKATVVVVDKNSLSTERGASFRKLVVTLSDLFKRPSEALDSILFVITKTSREDDISAIQADALKHKKRVFEEYQKAVNIKKEEVEKLPEKERREHEETIQMTQSQLEILEFIATHPQNIVLIDLFDHCGIYRLTSETFSEIKSKKKYNYNYIFVETPSPRLYYKTDNHLTEINLYNNDRFAKKLKLVCGKDFNFFRLNTEQIEDLIKEYSGHSPAQEVSKKIIRHFITNSNSINQDKFNYFSKDDDYKQLENVCFDIINKWVSAIESEEPLVTSNLAIKQELKEIEKNSEVSRQKICQYESDKKAIEEKLFVVNNEKMSINKDLTMFIENFEMNLKQYMEQIKQYQTYVEDRINNKEKHLFTASFCQKEYLIRIKDYYKKFENFYKEHIALYEKEGNTIDDKIGIMNNSIKIMKEYGYEIRYPDIFIPFLSWRIPHDAKIKYYQQQFEVYYSDRKKRISQIDQKIAVHEDHIKIIDSSINIQLDMLGKNAVKKKSLEENFELNDKKLKNIAEISQQNYGICKAIMRLITVIGFDLDDPIIRKFSTYLSQHEERYVFEERMQAIRACNFIFWQEQKNNNAKNYAEANPLLSSSLSL